MNFDPEEFRRLVGEAFYKSLRGHASSWRVEGDKLENVLNNFVPIFEAIADSSAQAMVSFDPVDK